MLLILGLFGEIWRMIRWGGGGGGSVSSGPSAVTPGSRTATSLFLRLSHSPLSQCFLDLSRCFLARVVLSPNIAHCTATPQTQTALGKTWYIEEESEAPANDSGSGHPPPCILVGYAHAHPSTVIAGCCSSQLIRTREAKQRLGDWDADNSPKYDLLDIHFVRIEGECMTKCGDTKTCLVAQCRELDQG